MRVAAKSLKNMAVRFVREESGQSTTEYVLLLLFVVIAVKAVGGGLKQRLEDIVNKAFGKATDEIE